MPVTPADTPPGPFAGTDSSAPAAPEGTLAGLGEAGLLDLLVGVAAGTAPAPGAEPAGDDAAVWSVRDGEDVVVSIDALVEGIDFRRGWITPRQLGRRAFAVAASDLAGTGARATHCLATLCARGAERVDDVVEIQRGLCEAAAAVGCAVAGGDVSDIDGPMVIDVCVAGAVPHGRSLRRDAGQPGDILVVTGILGRAAAGLRLLLDEERPASQMEERWVQAQLDPRARLSEGQALLERGVRCAGDISDGLFVDAARTARASACAAELWADRLPVDAHLRARFSQQWLELAGGGGEDFEVLAAVPAGAFDALLAAWPGDLARLTAVGRLCAGAGVRLLASAGGDELALPAARSRHFS